MSTWLLWASEGECSIAKILGPKHGPCAGHGSQCQQGHMRGRRRDRLVATGRGQSTEVLPVDPNPPWAARGYTSRRQERRGHGERAKAMPGLAHPHAPSGGHATDGGAVYDRLILCPVGRCWVTTRAGVHPGLKRHRHGERAAPCPVLGTHARSGGHATR
ncbi:hypothetical protein C8F01DRAFT_1174184 [Mycena amicta]|nr:hypothetical protein C8F01DRAFT_1174184 [Mycena amicta]